FPRTDEGAGFGDSFPSVQRGVYMGIQASITAIGLAAGIGMAAPVCDLVFQACPGRFDGKTITVPEETIWISPTVAACDDTLEVRTPGAASPPSIVFIID